MNDHEWCRDTARDEAVRAAEDAAAVPAIQHRDLPEIVADLRERVARLEAAQATLGSGDVFARLTAERDAAIRERDAPPRGWLTEEMRDDLDEALEWLNCQTNVFAKRAAAAIATTLARSTLPRVKMPSELMLCEARGVRIVYDAGKVKRAIRAAGGEVEG